MCVALSPTTLNVNNAEVVGQHDTFWSTLITRYGRDTFPILVDRNVLIGDDTQAAESEKGDGAPLVIGDLAIASPGDQCACCGTGVLGHRRGIEVGHAFYLGTTYSAPLDLGASEKFAFMGCYGLGATRLLAAIAEVNHDAKGFVWPEEVAPFRATIISTEANQEAANHLYDMLGPRGGSALYGGAILDDSGQRIGFQFNRSMASGIPYNIVCGRMIEHQEAGRFGGFVEIECRRTLERRYAAFGDWDSIAAVVFSGRGFAAAPHLLAPPPATA
ncbi:hypothetical protein H696_03025 [Fonticula alba]|uniref:Aminoacyl-transfer RNA synthetases class-II family profile domain-containing protein n=1 Tax=Fonticula alba TaxID=691883 RepID=A0A058Z8S5_FONAL|nr:hypothetical protein H696_03025 [Fonticula alba]KCV70670.1 hypothetical protein H696_03025 [Fonticula alba]|eukprot:XP_009495186.1 hypothetical protein H696_03025 [Fonticula alba]